jgi:single-strand DNA-binding protein
MGMFVNRVELIGNLGRDPEIRSTQQGKKVATLSIATSESWKDQQSGEWRERAEWHRVVIWNEGLAKIAEKHLEKGMKVRIEGKLRTRKWEDQSGQERYTTEIHVENFDGAINFDMKRDDDRASGGAGRERAREPAIAGAGGSTGAGFRGGDRDDDIPFSPCWQ